MTSCLEKYQPPPSKHAANFLVVDGFLDASSNTAIVKLSRTLPLSDSHSLPIESNAIVTIESEQGKTISTLKEATEGNYEASGLTLDAKENYRVHIVTNTGNSYVSDFIPLLITPSLDSITWKPDANGVGIYANAHDATTVNPYYKWDFTETWEYTTTFFSHFKRAGYEAIPRSLDEQIYTCWLNQPNTEILIGSTSRLNSNIVHEARLTYIPKGSLKLSRIYSILVHQKALTEEGYNYWLQLQKSTENLGGLFDPLPSQVLGNVHSQTDITEPVIGFFSGGAVENKRIFIQFPELPDHLLTVSNGLSCEKESVPIEKLNEIGNKVILEPLSHPGLPVTAYIITTFECGDCRVRGGDTIKPDYWIR